MERGICALLVPVALLGMYRSYRLAAADDRYRLDTPESLAQAVRIEPGNAEYHQLLAEHLESSGLDPRRERETATRLSPLESRYWIDRAAMEEAKADFPAAEKYYLKAASVDKTFGPRWALMNYYFRRHEEGLFWKWTREALPMAYGDVTPAFRLCWLMTDDAEAIRRLIPATESMRMQYLQFLMDDEHWEATGPVAREVAEQVSAEQLNVVNDCVSRLIVRNTGAAMGIWNTLSRRKLQNYGPLNPAKGAIITNGDFQTAPIERGFDWRPARTDGLSLTIGSEGLNVDLSGDQPLAVVVVNEWIPLEPGRRYRIEYSYSGESAETGKQDSGLGWRVTNATGAVIARSEDLREARNAEGDLEFTGGELTAATLSLVYERAPGTVRRPEKFTIHRVTARIP